jgi:hypothetical protein
MCTNFELNPVLFSSIIAQSVFLFQFSNFLNPMYTGITGKKCKRTGKLPVKLRTSCSFLRAISGRHRWPRQFNSTAVKVSIKAAGHAYAAGLIEVCERLLRTQHCTQHHTINTVPNEHVESRVLRPENDSCVRFFSTPTRDARSVLQFQPGGANCF